MKYKIETGYEMPELEIECGAAIPKKRARTTANDCVTDILSIRYMEFGVQCGTDAVIQIINHITDTEAEV